MLEGGKRVCLPESNEASCTPGHTTDGGGLGQLPRAERSPAGAATLRFENRSPPTPLRPPLLLPQSGNGPSPMPPRPPLPRPSLVLRPHYDPFQELQGKVMEAAAALDALRGGLEL